MCGICGTVGLANQDLLKKMCQAMRHRGPDDEGYFIDTDIGLGMRRLSIIDLDTGHQPIHNEDESIWIVFNGEIYNFQELRESLKKQGHQFYTRTDTEVIVHLYEQFGEDCVNYLNGMFAFAIWDKKKARLFIARDRLGVKPLYYALNNGNLIFASELKSILEYEKISREINREAIDCFLNFLYIPAPLSIFKGINKLLPGHTLTFQHQSLTIKRYWDLKIVKNNNTREEFYTESLYSLLKDAVKIRLISDVPLGVFLSGGMDSSTVVGLMAKLGSQPVKTFTIGYSDRDKSYNEIGYARLIAEHFKTEHREFIIEPDLIRILPKLVWHFDEPFADSSAIPTFIVSQIARENITVALNGIGGDENLAGYPRYIGAYLANYYQRIPLYLRQTIFNLIRPLPESTDSRSLVERAKRFARGGMLSPMARYIDWVSFLRKENKERIYTKEMLKALGNSDAHKMHLQYFQDVDADDFLDKIFYLDVKTYLADDLLFMADKMSMANSLELREPFCDYRLMEFSASIPFALKIKGMNLKYLLKKTTANLLPQEIVSRKKHGFMIPIARWLKDELKDWTSDLLSEANIKKRGYFNYEYIRWMLREHYQGKQNLDDQIWALLILEIWHQIYLDKKL
jgi:asparagine synthase (glutamine-hydrolysing)